MKTKKQLLNKYLLAITQHFSSQRWVISSLALLVCSLGYSIQPAHAEGSKELTASGGDRPFLEFRNDNNAGVLRRTIIKVYANVGETINLGSSATGIGSGVIRYRNPSNTQSTCPLTGVTGRILTRVEEVAGPLPNGGGYTPCIVMVLAGQAGVWEIEFASPDPTNTTANPASIGASANFPVPIQANNDSFVRAWDVTVRSSTGTTLPGRAFAKYISLNMGSNGRLLSSKVTILTRDGYQYSLDANGLDPFGFIFYADDNGFTDLAGKSLYRSIQLTGTNPGTLPSTVKQPTPGSADSISDITHKIFFNSPDPSLPSSSITPGGTTWLYSLPTPPPTASNLQFTGIDGTPGQAGTNLGGNFTFNPSSTGPYRLIIDINQDNILGNGNDRVLLGEATISTNTVFWDGKDGSGAIVPSGANFYRTTITFYTGEVHFPLIDAETNLTGIIVERLNNPVPATSPVPNPFLVYFDDRAVNPALSGTPLTNSRSPLNGLSGVIDPTGAHDYDVDFGNIRGIDTWAYYPSTVVELAGGVTVAEADFSITKTHSPTQITPGGPLTYTIRVTNNSTTVYGSSAVVTDTLDSSVTGATWTCAITTQGTGTGISSCANPSGTGNISSAVSLRPGGIAAFTINATLAPNFAPTTLSNTAIVSRSFDAADPNLVNNTATDVATISLLPNLLLVKRITAVNGINVTGFKDGVASPTTDLNYVGTKATDDNNSLWPSPLATSLRGAIHSNTIAPTVTFKPGDEVEYTIYFLNNGAAQANNVSICDFVPANQTYIGTGYTSLSTADAGGLAGSNYGIAILSANGGTPVKATNAVDGDRGQFYKSSFPSSCTGTTNGNGAVVVNMGSIPNAKGSGTPANSYGFIRFKAKID